MTVVSAWRTWSNYPLRTDVPAVDQTAGYEITPRLIPVRDTGTAPDIVRDAPLDWSPGYFSENKTTSFDVASTRSPREDGDTVVTSGFTVSGKYSYPSGTFAAYVPGIYLARATATGEPTFPSLSVTGWAYVAEGVPYRIEFSESGGTADTVSLSQRRDAILKMGRFSTYVFSGDSNDPSTLVPVEIEALVGFAGEIYDASILNVGEGYPPFSSLTVTVPTGDDNAEIQLDFDEWGRLANYTILSEGTGYPGISVVFFAPTPTTQESDTAPSGVHHIPQWGHCWRVAAQAGGHSVAPVTTRPRTVTTLETQLVSVYASEVFSSVYGFSHPLEGVASGFGDMAYLEGGMGDAFVWASSMTATVQGGAVASPGTLIVRFYEVEMQELSYDSAQKYSGGGGEAAAQLTAEGGWIPVATTLLGSVTIPAAAFTDRGDGFADPVTITLPTITAGAIVSATWALESTVADSQNTTPFTLCLISAPAAPAVGVHWTEGAYAWPLPPPP
jgi:hypothetical protein